MTYETPQSFVPLIYRQDHPPLPVNNQGEHPLRSRSACTGAAPLRPSSPRRPLVPIPSLPHYSVTSLPSLPEPLRPSAPLRYLFSSLLPPSTFNCRLSTSSPFQPSPFVPHPNPGDNID